jgi:hypothetical protein
MMKQPQTSPARRPGSARGVRTLALAAALCAAGTFQWSVATADRVVAWPDRQVDGRLVDVRIKVAGRPVVLYPSPSGDSRTYFEASRGRNYEVELHNATGQRVGVVISVDGLNVITGKRSTLSRHESMHVLDPWETTTIKGWRTSLSDVRKFVFVDEERSYAERTGQANGDMGWIRVASFREQRPIAWKSWEPSRIKEGDARAERHGLEESAPSAPRAQSDEAPAPMEKKSLRDRGAAELNGQRAYGEPEAYS